MAPMPGSPSEIRQSVVVIDIARGTLDPENPGSIPGGATRAAAFGCRSFWPLGHRALLPSRDGCVSLGKRAQAEAGISRAERCVRSSRILARPYSVVQDPSAPAWRNGRIIVVRRGRRRADGSRWRRRSVGATGYQARSGYRAGEGTNPHQRFGRAHRGLPER